MNANPYILLLLFFSISTLIYIGWKLKWTKIFISSETRRKTAIEDILKQLYHVEYSGKIATFNAMSGALNLSSSKLVELIEEMNLLGLIRNNGDILELTNDGRDYALKIIRIHRLCALIAAIHFHRFRGTQRQNRRPPPSFIDTQKRQCR